MSKSINVAIIGSGVVGSAFISQLAGLIKSSAVKYNVVYLARSSKEAIFSDDYANVDLSSYKTAAAKPVLSLDKLTNYLAAAGKPTVLVDNTSNATLADFYPKFVESEIGRAPGRGRG